MLSKKFACKICKKQFSTKGSLKTHLQGIHENIKFSCQQCDYKASQTGHLKTHVQSIHENIKFPCQQCDYKATESGILKAHIQSIHENGEKNIFKMFLSVKIFSDPTQNYL